MNYTQKRRKQQTTIREKLIQELKKLGAVPKETTSKKYLRFFVPEISRTYWVGKAGALRVGPTIAESLSAEETKLALLTNWSKTEG